MALTGTFRNNDVDLAGETYLDVTHMELELPAAAIPRPGTDQWLWVGLGLLGAAGSIAWRTRSLGARGT